MSEIKAFFIRLVILLIFLWLLFGVFFGITPMRGNDMFPRISAGDLLLTIDWRKILTVEMSSYLENRGK